MMMMIIIACGQWAGERPQIKANDHAKKSVGGTHRKEQYAWSARRQINFYML
jgi:hypothetical protein